MPHKVIDTFQYRGRKCVIIKKYWEQDYLLQLIDILPLSTIKFVYTPYHNGYVEISLPYIHYDFYNSYTLDLNQEVTFGGKIRLIDDGKTYIGFDTNHSHNTKKTKSRKYVKKELKQFTLQIIKHEQSFQVCGVCRDFMQLFPSKTQKADNILL